MSLFGDSRLPGRFWLKVERDEQTRCWQWVASKNSSGYGTFGVKRRIVATHRLTFSIFNGPLDSSLEIDHLCRNRACCNPAHLEQVTKRTNVLRGENNAAQNARKSVCKAGHPLEGENVYQNGNRRICKACRREVDKQRAHRRMRRSA